MGTFSNFLDSVSNTASDLVQGLQEARGAKPKPAPAPVAPPAPAAPVYTPQRVTQPAQPSINLVAPQPITESRTITTQELPQQSYTEAQYQDIPEPTSQAMADYEAARGEMQQSPVYQAGRAGIAQDIQQSQQELDNIYREAESAFNNMQDPSQFGNYWESKNVAGKIMAGLGMAFATLGAGISGKPRQALEFIDNAIERDTQMKRDKLNRQLKIIANSKESANIKGKKLMYLQQALEDLDNGKAYAVTIARAKALAAKTGKPEHKDFVKFMEQAAKTDVMKRKADYYQQAIKADQFKARSYEPVGEAVPLTRTETSSKTVMPPKGDMITQKDRWKMTNDLTSSMTKPIPKTLKQVAIAANTLLASIDDAIRKRAAGVRNPYTDVFTSLQGAKIAQGDTSVVRAPEHRVFTGAGSLLTKVENYFRNLESGATFSDLQYRQLADALRMYAKFTASAYNQEVSPVINRARKSGLDINDIYSSGSIYFDPATEHDDNRIKWEYNQRKGRK